MRYAEQSLKRTRIKEIFFRNGFYRDRVWTYPGLVTSSSDLRWARNPLIFEDFFCPSDIGYLGCRARAKNLINQKMGLFYIEAIPQFFFNFEKIFFFASPRNNDENCGFALIFRKLSKLNRFLYPHSTL